MLRVVSGIENPLVDPPPREVPLARSPLERVLAQVRYPEILTIEERGFVAPFQEAIRSTYPVLRQEQTQTQVVAFGSMLPGKPETAWRFENLDGTWRVSLTPQFLALETTKYTSRSDFFRRFREVVVALDRHVEPKLVDRLGVRYIDRLTGAAVDEIATLVRPEVQGIAGSPVAAYAAHAVSEAMFELDATRVVARWGNVPPGHTVDPAIEPAQEKSWIIDLDMFTAKPMPFAVDPVVIEAQGFAERIYTFFRWAVTTEFLRRYGGEP
jgi:uncharacterized protein (TIGR04255 family)